MNDERETPYRRRLDKIEPRRDQRLRVFFPAGKPPRVMVATGTYDREKGAYEMRDETSQTVEWVPGWLVASELSGARPWR